MAITASSPDAFFESEDWAFGFTVNQPDGLGPLDLTGSRLFVRFCDGSRTTVGVCDSAANDQSLVIAPGATGAVTFCVASAGRTWRAPLFGLLMLRMTVPVVGDLYRYPPGGGDPVGVCSLRLDILPSTGPPS